MVLGLTMTLGGQPRLSAAQQETIQFWNPFPFYAAVYAKLKDEFNKQDPSITVDINTMDENAYRTAVKTALASRTGPDIITSVPGRGELYFLADTGALADLTAAYQQYNWAQKYPKWILDGLTHTTRSGQKGIWAVPTHTATEFLFYNTHVFQARGWQEPKTLDQLISFCHAASASGVIPFAFGEGDGGWLGVGFFSYLLDQTLGASGVSALINGKGSWTSVGSIKAAAIFLQLKDAGCFEQGVVSTGADPALALWMAGKAAITYNGDWTFATIQKQDPGLYASMDLVPGPRVALNAPWWAVSDIGDSMAVTAFSTHKEAALKWINFMVSKTGQLIWLNDAKRVIAWTALATAANGASPLQLKDAKLISAGTAKDVSSLIWVATYSTLEQNLQEILNGSTTPAQGMQAVETVDRAEWKKNSP